MFSPIRVGADKEDQLQQDPSLSDVYEPVKLDSPRQFMNRMYGARPSSERMVLINNSDHTPGVTNNCGKRNEDGLIYADLDLAQPALVDGMPIIHSREEPVVYEEIDFFLTPGPQLPDKIWEVEEDDDDCW
ncbi:uncharacterized protein [Haliotis cracherodii]|uniref:uncharacterized protein n=1 Tax=Haliotis cracherodii TaxID=6455 RepID=UPI0039EA2D26